MTRRHRDDSPTRSPAQEPPQHKQRRFDGRAVCCDGLQPRPGSPRACSGIWSQTCTSLACSACMVAFSFLPRKAVAWDRHQTLESHASKESRPVEVKTVGGCPATRPPFGYCSVRLSWNSLEKKHLSASCAEKPAVKNPFEGKEFDAAGTASCSHALKDACSATRSASQRKMASVTVS